MDISESIKTTSSPVPSPDGLHIASLTSSRLTLRSTRSLSAFRTINLPPSLCDKTATLRWCRPLMNQPWCYRFLIFTPDAVRVWDLRDAKWTVKIDNGSGGMGKITNADFSFDSDGVMVWNDFGSKVTVWSLITGRSIEIKDPKFATGRGCACRPGEGAKLCALLSRSGAQDVLTLHAPKSWNVLRSIVLSTHDAQGLKWSPDGRWLAIWDAASVGTKVYIYTADGCLYKTYSGEVRTDEELQLGVKSLEWSPDGQFLAVGGYGRRVVMLSTRSFAPKVYLEHTASVQIAEGQVWQENVSAAAKREYATVTQPVTPPLATASSIADLSRTGISTTAFNSDGTMLATRDDHAPTTVWIWDLATLKPRTILIQHSPVKRLSWHSTRPDLLLVQCTHDEAVGYIWAALSDHPIVFTAPLQRSTGKLEIVWLPSKQDRKPALLVHDSNGFIVVWPDGRDPVEESGAAKDEEDGEDIDQSLDSVVEMLAGRTPMPEAVNTTGFEQTFGDIDDGFTTGSFDDTFRGKRPLGLA